MRKKLQTEIKVGIFVTVGVGLIMLAILLLGGAESLFTRHNEYTIHLDSVEGLVTGAKVVLNGIRVGIVDDIDLDVERKDIKVALQVTRKYEKWIRKDSLAEVMTQGVLGDKYVSITTGKPEEPMVDRSGEITVKPTKDLTQFLTKGDTLLVHLNSITNSLDHLVKGFEKNNRSDTIFQGLALTAKNMASASQKLNEELDQMQLKKATKSLNSILEKVNNGTGTLGALINDPALYYDARSLLGGANRNRVVRNLVRKTIEDAETKDDQDAKKK